MKFKKKSHKEMQKLKENTNSMIGPFKIFFIIILFSYKYLYQNNVSEIKEERIEDFFPKIYNKSNELQYAKKYYEICKSGKLYGPKRFKRNLTPKFSVIIPVYNRENFITRVLRSIQNQSYKNIEIIFVDDYSLDNSVGLIEENKRKDKRIRLIKHKENKGTLITRNDGGLSARGEYVLFVDPDDILYEGILKKLDGATEFYDVDVIRFDAFFKHGSFIKKYDYGNSLKRNQVIMQPEIFNQGFYFIGNTLYQQNLFLWGKIIRKKLFLEILDNLTDFYKRQHWTLYEDNALDFIIIRYAQSYAFIKENGYVYCYNGDSSYSNRNNKAKANRTVKDVFLLSEICFDYTNDNGYEKQMAMTQLRRFISEYKDSLKNVSSGFDYYFRVLNKFINCKSLTQRDRIILNQIKETLENAKNKN